ncbi:MAG: ABC transporter transmembrane domain-containing protein [Chthoniobacterales bacterium]
MPQENSPSEEAPKVRIRRESLMQAAGIFRYLLPYKIRFTGAVIALLLSTSLGLAFPYLTGVLLDASAHHSAAALSEWKTSINMIAIVLLCSLALQAFFSYFSTYWFYRSGESALVDLRRETFAKLIGQPMVFFSQRRVGELSSRLTTDLTLIQETLTMTTQQFLRQTILMSGGILLVAIISIRLTGLMILTFPVLILVAIIFGKFIRGYSREAQDRMADGGTVIEESLQGIATVKAFGNEPFELNRYAHYLRQYLNVIIKTARLRALMVSFIIFGIFGSIVLVFWYGAHLMQTGQLSFGELTSFIIYTTFVGGSVASFADVFSQVQKTLGATERVRELLAENPEIDSRALPPAMPAPRLRGEVRFENVSFRYPSRLQSPVLHELTLHANPGEKIALVGASGAGKSTIASLLLRFYDPDSGTVRIDGRPSTEYSLTDLRHNMAIVPQEVLLFGGSIEENIRYGKPNASHEEVIAASKQAACHEFIEEIPEGYDTVVGDRGIKLSGGQRQRIAIARALLKDPSILILDEATSSLDSESEQLIQQALSTLLEGRTAFIIAHRLSTIRKVDRIYVIEDGRILESGTHDELITRDGGTYRRLSEIQFGETETSP